MGLMVGQPPCAPLLPCKAVLHLTRASPCLSVSILFPSPCLGDKLRAHWHLMEQSVSVIFLVDLEGKHIKGPESSCFWCLSEASESSLLGKSIVDKSHVPSPKALILAAKSP